MLSGGTAYYAVQVALTVGSWNTFLNCGHSFESYFSLLSTGAVYKAELGILFYFLFYHLYWTHKNKYKTKLITNR